jgi:hypothetical protein
VSEDGIAQNIQGQTHCCLVQRRETRWQDSFSFSRRTTTTTIPRSTTTPGDPKHGNNQPDLHDNNNNNNTQQQRHNNKRPETWLNLSGIQELVANADNLPSTPHIVVVRKLCSLATVTFFAWSMPGNPEP